MPPQIVYQLIKDMRQLDSNPRRAGTAKVHGGMQGQACMALTLCTAQAELGVFCDNMDGA